MVTKLTNILHDYIINSKLNKGIEFIIFIHILDDFIEYHSLPLYKVKSLF